MDLAGAPLAGRIIGRVKHCRGIDDIVLAVPDRSEDRVLEQVDRDYNVTVSAGSENDLVERYYQAALVSGADSHRSSAGGQRDA